MQTLCADLGQAKCFIKFAVGEQSGVGGDLAPQEIELLSIRVEVAARFRAGPCGGVCLVRS